MTMSSTLHERNAMRKRSNSRVLVAPDQAGLQGEI